MDCGFLDLSCDDPELELDESLFFLSFLSLSPWKNCEQQQPIFEFLNKFTFQKLSSFVLLHRRYNLYNPKLTIRNELQVLKKI